VAASGVTPTFGVATSDKDSAPMAISEMAVVAASIEPHEFLPGLNIGDSTGQICSSHGDLDAQTDDFGSPQKNCRAGVGKKNWHNNSPSFLSVL
jgi:hypothetical protein